MKAVKTIANIVLAFGAVLIFNESSTFVPNILGLACMALLIWINADKEDAYDEV